MESPRSYRGYDENGKVVSSATARDANSEINPAEVKTAIENVKTVFAEQMQTVANALTALGTDADEAVIVQGTSMDATIEETAQLLTTIGDSVTQGIDELYTYAVQAHDEIQRQLNSNARSACWTNGAVSVS